MTKPVRVEQSRLMRKVALLIKGLTNGMTYMELAQFTGLNRNTVERWVGALHNEDMAHISDIREDARGALRVRVLKLGPGKDFVAITKHQLRRKEHANLVDAMHALAGGNVPKRRGFMRRLHKPPK